MNIGKIEQWPNLLICENICWSRWGICWLGWARKFSNTLWTNTGLRRVFWTKIFGVIRKQKHLAILAHHNVLNTSPHPDAIQSKMNFCQNPKPCSSLQPNLWSIESFAQTMKKFWWYWHWNSDVESLPNQFWFFPGGISFCVDTIKLWTCWRGCWKRICFQITQSVVEYFVKIRTL